jgi:hypothetical protein
VVNVRGYELRRFALMRSDLWDPERWEVTQMTDPELDLIWNGGTAFLRCLLHGFGQPD